MTINITFNILNGVVRHVEYEIHILCLFCYKQTIKVNRGMNEDLLKRQLAVIMARFSDFEKKSEKQLSNHEKRLNDLEKTNKDVKIDCYFCIANILSNLIVRRFFNDYFLCFMAYFLSLFLPVPF